MSKTSETLYNSPVSTHQFQHKGLYQGFLYDLHWDIVDDMGWKEFRERKTDYQKIRKELHSKTNMASIMEWLNNHSIDVLISPIVANTRNQSGSYTAIRIQVSKYVKNFNAVVSGSAHSCFNYSETGNGWRVRFEAKTKQSSTPKFSINDVCRGLTSLGILVTEYVYQGIDKNDGLQSYDIDVFFPSRIWKQMTVYEKLRGNI